MDYLTTAEMAKVWNVSQRWVAILCKQGKIEGAILKEHTWFLPKYTKKPEDHRYRSSKAQKV